jgi:hypothetical protein
VLALAGFRRGSGLLVARSACSIPSRLAFAECCSEWFEPLIRLKRGARCSEPPPHQGAQQYQSLARVCTPRLALGEAEFPWASWPWLLLLLVAERLTPRCWLDCLFKPTVPPQAGASSSRRTARCGGSQIIQAKANCITSILLPLHSSLCPPLPNCDSEGMEGIKFGESPIKWNQVLPMFKVPYPRRP